MNKSILLLLTANLALWAQVPAPPPPAPKLPPMAAWTESISTRVSAKAAGAMSRVDARMPFVFAPKAIFQGRTTDHERSYQRGVSAIDGRRYEQAMEAFSQAAMTTGSRVDGALYWKAFALHRLGRRDGAMAALAELRKSHGSSRWLGDAQVLESALKQDSGQKTAAQWEAEEDLKVLALSGLIHSDAEKAAALVEQVLQGSPYPKLKDKALQALSSSDSPRSREQLVQTARGTLGNPDLQLVAIRHLGSRRTDNRQLLREIYNSTTDGSVKRAALRALGSSGASDEIWRILKAEKEPSLRREAVTMLGRSTSSAELWTLYQAEPAVEVKEVLLHRLREGGATERLLDVARTEKDPKLRRSAIHSLGSVTSSDALVAMFGSEADESVKRSIVDSLHSHNNGKALVELARKEKDPESRREIVSRLSRMNRSKEATDYMLEILK